MDPYTRRFYEMNSTSRGRDEDKYLPSHFLPGLSNPPPLDDFYIQGILNNRSKFLPIISLNFDYIPMSLESPRQLWLDLVEPAPYDLHTQSPVRIHLNEERGIDNAVKGMPWTLSMFNVEDIIGSRIVLTPYRGSTWLPNEHSEYPGGWGYDTSTVNVRPPFRYTKFGYGAARAFLEYTPSRPWLVQPAHIAVSRNDFIL